MNGRDADKGSAVYSCPYLVVDPPGSYRRRRFHESTVPSAVDESIIHTSLHETDFLMCKHVTHRVLKNTVSTRKETTRFETLRTVLPTKMCERDHPPEFAVKYKVGKSNSFIRFRQTLFTRGGTVT